MAFISETHIKQLLPPDSYVSEKQFQIERQRLFLPAWHCVAQTADLAHDGDFKTLTLLGHPLILWRTEGEIRCYLNVCSHRHCLLTGQAAGSMPMLRCQYHGWEYDREGDTRRIPDARSFRPLAPGTLGLSRYQVETVGQLVFVSLAAQPESLDQQLGGQRAYLEDLFSDQWQPLLTVAQEVEANWKVLAENVLEGYHLEAVHVNTFRKFAPAEACRHELQDRFTTYTETPLEANAKVRRQADFVARLLGVHAEPEYHHLYCYPNLAASRMTLYNWAETILPVAPGRAINYWQIFQLRGTRRSPAARLAAAMVGRHGRKFFKEAMREDGVVMPGVQAGMAAAKQSSGGLISAREERIFHFQQHVLDRTTGHDLSPMENTQTPQIDCEGNCHVSK
jgi:phenylpropionate dioxygenase-like ring-hydroxylating dioxygenase large terminal subunit